MKVNKYATRKHRVRRHATRESIIKTVFGGAVTPHGFKRMKALIGRWGMWASVNVLTNTIHIWHDGKRTESQLTALFAHEIGHITGKEERKSEAEEARADSYSDVAVKALRLARKYAK